MFQRGKDQAARVILGVQSVIPARSQVTTKAPMATGAPKEQGVLLCPEPSERRSTCCKDAVPDRQGDSGTADEC